MPAFNIPCTHKYLVVNGIDSFHKVNSFKEAVKLTRPNEGNVYEHIGNPGDWYILAENIKGNIVSCILGQLPND